ncbi:TorD/DmsD family molecular chaperone [Haladaptatus sp. NG-SE-30]
MDDIDIYDARMELLDYCIDVFWDTPTESFLEQFLHGDITIPSTEVDPTLDEGFSQLESFIETNDGRDVPSVQDELAAEYSRVFVGPRPPVVAHETYYRDDTDFMGKGLAAVQASYDAAEWSPPEEYPEEDDFIAVELAFLRILVERQRNGVVEAFGFERVFLDEHLLEWIDDFAEETIEETDEPFYQAGARIVAGTIAFEDELVAQMVSG